MTRCRQQLPRDGEQHPGRGSPLRLITVAHRTRPESQRVQQAGHRGVQSQRRSCGCGRGDTVMGAGHCNGVAPAHAQPFRLRSCRAWRTCGEYRIVSAWCEADRGDCVARIEAG